MHPLGVGAVEVDHVGRDPLAEVGLEGIDALVEQRAQLALVPLGRIRIGEVDQAHAGLPEVGLPDITVGLLDEVAGRLGLGEQRRALRDVGVDPDADVQALLVQPGEHALRVRGRCAVPLEVAPVELAHPEAVEVEHRQRQVTLGHLVDEAGDGRLVVVRGEAGGQPQAVGPGGHGGRTPGQGGVALEDLFGCRPVDDEVLQALPRHRELHPLDSLGADLVGDVPRVVDQHAIAAVRQVERNVLVGLLARGAAVGVPDVDDLAVLHHGPEALAEPVDELADPQRQLFMNVGSRVGRMLARSARDNLQVGDGLVPARGEGVAIRAEREIPRRPRRHRGAEPAAGQGARSVRHRHLAMTVLRTDQVEPELFAQPLEVLDPHADDVRQRRAERDGQSGAVQGVATTLDDLGRCRDGERPLPRDDVVRLSGVERRHSGSCPPESVRELHCAAFRVSPGAT